MPLGQSQDIPQTDPGGMATPRFWHRLIRFRHFIDGSLALASLNRACRNLVPTFPQRSPPWLLPTAACGGLRSTADCRPRRALLHLQYSCASPCGPAMLVTQGPQRTCACPLGSLVSPSRAFHAVAISGLAAAVVALEGPYRTSKDRSVRLLLRAKKSDWTKPENIDNRQFATAAVVLQISSRGRILRDANVRATPRNLHLNCKQQCRSEPWGELHSRRW